MTDYWYLVIRHGGPEQVLSIHDTRHDAVGFMARCHALKREWLRIEPVSPLAWFNLTPRETPEFDPYRQVQA